jgi:hypothetical protein
MTYLNVSNVMLLDHINRTEAPRSSGRICEPTIALDITPTNVRFGESHRMICLTHFTLPNHSFCSFCKSSVTSITYSLLFPPWKR